MSNKRKPSADEQITNSDNEDKKRQCSESNKSQSSWLHRLTSNDTSTSIPNTSNATLQEQKPSSTAEEEKVENGGNRIWSKLLSNYYNHSSTTTTNTTTITGAKPVTTTNDADIIEPYPTINKEEKPDDLIENNSKTSYWRSLFYSNNGNTKGDEPIDIIPENQSEQTTINVKEEEEEEAGEKNNQSNGSNSIKKHSVVHNVVLPSFHSQFQSSSSLNSSIFSKAVQAINYLFSNNESMAYKRLCFNKLSAMIETMKQNPEDCGRKRFLIIGVHGWFPMKLVRSVIGEPTGTSTKFCEQMITAVKRYFHENHNLAIPEESITTIPLEWEGKVLERVDRFYQQLTETKELSKLIKEADVILWATHSQGTPVSTILLRRLIDNKMIDIERQPVCMLAMAGIFYGPFPSIRGNLVVKYFEADAARELFEFMDSKSDISIEFQDAISSVLSHAYFKIVLVGSMQDQVVPLYSSIMSGVIHPRILRAIYIDGELYNPNDFLVRLILFALKLLNLGLSDHGLLIHLSQALAGNFWQGEGHSTIYEEIDVFTLSLQYLFETSPFGSFEITKTTNTYQKLNDTKKKISINTSKLLNNPFHLPWAVRGIWDDRRIHEDERLSGELVQLQGLFDQWHPATTRLKEIKFRLEPLRARL